MVNYYSFGVMKQVRFRWPNENKNDSFVLLVLGDKEVSRCLLDLRVDGLIFDHVAELKDEYSKAENLFICKA